MAGQSNFQKFLNDIEPSETTKQRAKSAHETLRSYLENHEMFKGYHVKTFLSGSYKRNTAIRPKTKDGEIERPDVDIIVVTNHTLSDYPQAVITLLYNTLKEKYSDIRKQSRSVGIATSTVDMDVVPIIAPFGIDGTLYIPDRKLDSWLKTNPLGHTEWTTEMNKKFNDRFKPMVKLLKFWRRENPTISNKPKGFVLECITAECMDVEIDQYPESFVRMLENVTTKYYSNILLEP
jgi:predicted nucleotidyltransferase